MISKTYKKNMFLDLFGITNPLNDLKDDRLLYVGIQNMRIRKVENMETYKNKTEEKKKNIPVKSLSAGNIFLTIWENEGKNDKGVNYSFLTLGLERRYKDDQGEWKGTNSFRVNDVPRIQMLCNKAFEFATLKERSKDESEE